MQRILDRKGGEIRIGQRVMVEATVTDIVPATGSLSGCNVLIRLDAPRGEVTPVVACNSLSLELHGSSTSNTPAVVNQPVPAGA